MSSITNRAETVVRRKRWIHGGDMGECDTGEKIFGIRSDGNPAGSVDAAGFGKPRAVRAISEGAQRKRAVQNGGDRGSVPRDVPAGIGGGSGRRRAGGAVPMPDL